MARGLLFSDDIPPMRPQHRTRNLHTRTRRPRRRRRSRPRTKGMTNGKEKIVVSAPADFSQKFVLLNHKLGGGSFGNVYRGQHIANNSFVAIKVEDLKDKVESTSLYGEHQRYAVLCSAAKTYGPAAGLPECHMFCRMEVFGGPKVVMVMDECGPNLETLFSRCGRKFSLKTLIMIAIQLLDRLEFIHSTHHLHRDIKPENFCIGSPDLPFHEQRNLIYVLDFGLSKKYSIQHDNKDYHIPGKTGKNLCGTARYVSIRTHDGYEQSRRDDIEAVAYLLIYFWRGNLPWQTGIRKEDPKPKSNRPRPRTNRDKYKPIADLKKSIEVEELCGDLPKPFVDLLNYGRKELDFEDKPDYDYFKRKFYDLFVANQFPNDNNYDWDIVTGKSSSQTITPQAQLQLSPVASRHTSNIAVRGTRQDVPATIPISPL